MGENGADVVKIHINVKHHASQTLFGSFEEERGAIEAMLAEAKGPYGHRVWRRLRRSRALTSRRGLWV